MRCLPSLNPSLLIISQAEHLQKGHDEDSLEYLEVTMPQSPSSESMSIK